MAKAKFQATIQKNDAHINVLLGKNNDLNTLIRVSPTASICRRLNALRTNIKNHSAQIGEMRAQNLEILQLERTLSQGSTHR